MRALPARVARHARRDKTLRWHIDYFRRHARFIGVQMVVSTRPGDEERLAARYSRWLENRREIVPCPPPRFGASDSACPARLFYWGDSIPTFL